MKKLIKILMFTGLLLLMAGAVKEEAAKAEEMFDNQENGIVKVTYNNTSKKKTLLLVEHVDTYNVSSNRYSYLIKEGKNELDIPLTEGNGTYKFRIAELIENGRYAVLKSQNIELEIDDADEVFIHSSTMVDYQLTDKAVRKAKSLAKKYDTEEEYYKAIYEYIVQHFVYDYDELETKTGTSYYIPDINLVYKSKKGICCDISMLAAAMMRSQGIETRVIYGYTPNVSVYHAWNQVYNEKEDTWYTLDITYDMCKYQKGVKVKMIKEDSEYNDISYRY